MDCVGCDKCRLWGKLQVSGFGTALKILFELDEKALEWVWRHWVKELQLIPSPKVNPDLLQRSEVVALFNTLHRTSESLAAVEHFRQMYADTQAAELEYKLQLEANAVSAMQYYAEMKLMSRPQMHYAKLNQDWRGQTLYL